MRFTFKIAILLCCVFIGLQIDRTVNALSAQDAQRTPAAVAPIIKTEDALAISKIETQIEANLIEKLQLEAAYKANAGVAKTLSDQLQAADAAALKNAGADAEKFTVDHAKIVIAAKPPVVPPKK